MPGFAFEKDAELVFELKIDSTAPPFDYSTN